LAYTQHPVKGENNRDLTAVFRGVREWLPTLQIQTEAAARCGSYRPRTEPSGGVIVLTSSV